MTSQPLTADLTRRAPAAGGFNLTLLRLEIRRLLRNRRTVLFTMVLPVFFFLLFGLNSAYANEPNRRARQRVRFRDDQPGPVRRGAGHHQRRGHGGDRAGGRLEPAAADHPAQPGGLHRDQDADRDGARAQLADRGLRGRRDHRQAPDAGWMWIASALAVWIGSLVFAAFGLFMGYLLPTENVMQILGFVLVIFASPAALFIPLSQYPHVVQDIAQYTPLYGLQPAGACAAAGNRRRTWPGSPTPSPGWAFSARARSGGSARTPPGSDRIERLTVKGGQMASNAAGVTNRAPGPVTGLEPDAIGVAQDTVIGMASSAPAPRSGCRSPRWPWPPPTAAGRSSS